MNFNEAVSLFKKIQNGRGTGDLRENFQSEFKLGSIAEKLWHDPEFTLGVEYGILIALQIVYGLTQDDMKRANIAKPALEAGTFDRFTFPTLMKVLPDMLRKAEKVDREKLHSLVSEQCMMIDQPEFYEKTRKAIDDTSRWFSDPMDVCGFTDEQKKWFADRGVSLSSAWILTYRVVIKSDDPRWKYGWYYGTSINAVCTPRPADMEIDQVHMEIDWDKTIDRVRRWLDHVMETEDFENPERFE